MTDINPTSAVLELAKLSRTLDEAGYRLQQRHAEVFARQIERACGATAACGASVPRRQAAGGEASRSVRA